MQSHQQRRGGHHDQLNEVVEANLLAARLLCVADEVFELVLPHLLGGGDVHQDAKHEEDGEPDPPDDSRESPVHMNEGLAGLERHESE
uniref:Uncharacterized protein n=1 Tax=Sinocyclocheilus grahami TaxID=75366 RepID=A0A672NZ38_SINGR